MSITESDSLLTALKSAIRLLSAGLPLYSLAIPVAYLSDHQVYASVAWLSCHHVEDLTALESGTEDTDPSHLLSP